jgi:hypothetical protein
LIGQLAIAIYNSSLGCVVFHKAWIRLRHCQSCESEEASLLKLKWHLANSSYHYTKEEDMDDVLNSAMVTQDFVPRKELEFLLEKEGEARQKAEETRKEESQKAPHPKRHKGPQQPKMPPPNNRGSSSARASSDGDNNRLAVIGRGAVAPTDITGGRSSIIPLDTSELFSMQTQ